MYLIFALVAGVIGTLLSGMMRLELQEPGIQIFHGLASMVYGVAAPPRSTPASTCTMCSPRPTR